MCAAKKIIRTQNGCQVSKDTTFGRCLRAKAHKLQLLYIFVLKVIEVYRQSVKKRRAISPEEKCLLLKPNLTNFTMFTSIPRYTIAREIVGTIYTRCTISTGVVSTFIDIYQNNSK